MISLRLAVPAVLVAAVAAGCFAYFVAPPPQVGDDQRLPPSGKMPEAEMGVPIEQDPSGENKVDAFLQTARGILKQVPNAQASADNDPATNHRSHLVAKKASGLAAMTQGTAGAFGVGRGGCCRTPRNESSHSLRGWQGPLYRLPLQPNPFSAAISRRLGASGRGLLVARLLCQSTKIVNQPVSIRRRGDTTVSVSIFYDVGRLLHHIRHPVAIRPSGAPASCYAS